MWPRKNIDKIFKNQVSSIRWEKYFPFNRCQLNSIFEFGFSFIRYFKSVVKFTFVGEASVVFSAIFHVNDTAKDIFPKSKTWKLTKSKGISFHLNFYSLILNFRVCFGTFLMVLNCSHYWYYWKLFKFSQPENNWFS